MGCQTAEGVTTVTTMFKSGICRNAEAHAGRSLVVCPGRVAFVSTVLFVATRVQPLQTQTPQMSKGRWTSRIDHCQEPRARPSTILLTQSQHLRRCDHCSLGVALRTKPGHKQFKCPAYARQQGHHLVTCRFHESHYAPPINLPFAAAQTAQAAFLRFATCDPSTFLLEQLLCSALPLRLTFPKIPSRNRYPPIFRRARLRL